MKKRAIERLLLATGLLSCVAAPALVALGAAPAARFGAVLALLVTAPGGALAALARRGHAPIEAGLIVGVSLAGSLMGAQAMLWLGAWQPRAATYLVAAVCLPALALGLRRSLSEPVGGAFAGGVRASLRRAARRMRLGVALLGHVVVVGVAIALWATALARVDVSDIGGHGLLDALPASYFVAVGLLVCGFGVAIGRRSFLHAAAAVYVLALVVVIHATTPLLYDTPRYTWVYKHFGVIEAIASSGSVDRAADIYQNWPAFFAANAWLSRVSGVAPMEYAAWAQAAFTLVALAVVRFALGGVTRDSRLLWAASGLFVLGNWVGQEYLAPQGLAFALALVILGLCLRTNAGAAPAGVALGIGSRWALALGGLCYLAIVVSHQLTPVILIAGVAVLVVTRRVPGRVLGAMVAVEVAWVALAWPFLRRYIDLFSLDPFAIARPQGYAVGQGQPGLELSAYSARGIVVALIALAAIGAVRRARAGHRDLVVVGLALAPVAVLAAQSYGGEALFRVYLFGLPWIALLAAAACLPRRGSRRPVLARLPIVAVGAVLGAALLPAYFGLEKINRVDADDVRAAAWYERNAPRGSVLVYLAPNFPVRLTQRYTRVHLPTGAFHPNLVEDGRLRHRRLGEHDVAAVARLLRSRNASHLVLSPGQTAYVELYGLLGADSVARLSAALERSPKFRVAHRDGGSIVFELRA